MGRISPPGGPFHQKARRLRGPQHTLLRHLVVTGAQVAQGLTVQPVTWSRNHGIYNDLGHI